MRIPLRQGRNFEARDTEKSPLICLVNESFARRLFPGESAIGNVLLRGANADIKFEIVGIVGDVKSTGLTAPPPRRELHFLVGDAWWLRCCRCINRVGSALNELGRTPSI